MFACFDVVVFEVLGYKTQRLKAKHQERSEARQKIRDERKQAKATPKEIDTERQRETRTTKQLSSQHKHH
jgi:hypothetical protein